MKVYKNTPGGESGIPQQEGYMSFGSIIVWMGGSNSILSEGQRHDFVGGDDRRVYVNRHLCGWGV